MYKKRHKPVLGIPMAFVEHGKGDPIVFLHGNPTSSFLWRSVMPEVERKGRLIAPDLLGMGDSGKLVPSGINSYTFDDHRTYLDGLLDVLGVRENVTLVVHDWGSALGFDWAFRHPGAVRAIVYMEGLVRPLKSWNEWPEVSRKFFQALRGDAGEDLILAKNYFIERVLPASIMRDLSEAEMNEYRRPFRDVGESRRPTLTWPRQIPIGGEPADVHAVVDSYSNWMAENDLPKLFINGDPGLMLVGGPREFCRTWRNQTEVTVPGLHFLQEDSGPEIGRAIADWLSEI